MPRGQPDYGVYQQQQVITGLADVGEAAARLGSINVYDRRGFTAWQDDFEATILRWAVNSSAASPNPILSTTDQWMGVQSIYFATVAGVGEFGSITKSFPLIRLGKIGIEFFIHLSCRAPGYFQVRIRIQDGTNIADAELRLDSRARTASIVTPAGVQVISTNCFPGAPTTAWIPFKLVADMDTDLYSRLLAGDREYDISSHALVPIGATTDRMIYLYMALNGDVIATMFAYLDNFILTQNEP